LGINNSTEAASCNVIDDILKAVEEYSMTSGRPLILVTMEF